MKSRWMAFLSVGVAIAIMAVTLGSTALAQTETPVPAPTDQAPAPGTTPAAPAARYNALVTSLATALGMAPADVLTERRAGKSYADLAAEKGVDLQTLTDAVIKTQMDAIDTRLANQAITQKQADWMKKALQNHADLLLTAPFVVNASGFGMGMGMGMMGPGMGSGMMGPGMMNPHDFGWGRDDDDWSERGDKDDFRRMPGRGFGDDDNRFGFGNRGMGRPGPNNAPAAPAAPEASPTAPGTSGA